MNDLKTTVLEICVRGDIHEISLMLTTIQSLLNDRSPLAAGLRASCARLVLELAQEIVEMTG